MDCNGLRNITLSPHPIGADVIGVNCMYDPEICLETLAMMKAGLESAGLKAYLMVQPVGFHTQEVARNPEGYMDLPEFPFGKC